MKYLYNTKKIAFHIFYHFRKRYIYIYIYQNTVYDILVQPIFFQCKIFKIFI